MKTGFLSAPAVHFVVLGALLFAFTPPDRPVIVVSRAHVDALRGDGDVVWDRASPETRRALIEQVIDDEILLREAWARGVPDRDPVVAERLERIGRFVSQHGDEEQLDASDAVDGARELGLERGDVVIRRYLKEMMRLAIAREADRHLPTEADLEAHLREHRERFVRPAQVRLTQVFVSSRRGAGREEYAHRLLGELSALAPEEAASQGDPFPVGREFVAGRKRLMRTFGVAFADAVAQLETGRWGGPIESAYGSHLVWVHERTSEALPALDEVRSQVVHHWLRVRRAEHLRQRLTELRDRYEIRVAASG